MQLVELAAISWGWRQRIKFGLVKAARINSLLSQKKVRYSKVCLIFSVSFPYEEFENSEVAQGKMPRSQAKSI